MAKRYNCIHPESFEGEACAACLAEAYDLLDEAEKIMGHPWNKIVRTHQVVAWEQRRKAMQAPEDYKNMAAE